MALIRHPKDFWSGVMFIAVGGAACVIALDYAMGSAGRMGPGYFPRVLGLLLCALGAILVVRSFTLRGAPLTFPAFKPLLFVLASVVIFGLVVVHVGLVIATMVLVAVSSMASHEYRPRESVFAAIALAAFVVVAFRYGLNLQLPTWPPALAG